MNDKPEKPQDDDAETAPAGDKAGSGPVIEGEVLTGAQPNGAAVGGNAVYSTKPENGGGPGHDTAYGAGGAGGPSGGTPGGGYGGGGGAAGSGGVEEPEDGQGNIWIRLLFMIGFGFLAWVVVWLTLFMAGLQFIVAVLNKELNEDLRQFSRRMVLYLRDLLGFVSFHTEDKPFPLGPFPKDDLDA